jgi:2-haloacid dehalogenase
MPSRRSFIAGSLAGAALSSMPNAAAMQPRRRRTVIVLDVIETMLDLNALRPEFTRVFGDGGALNEWFSTLLLYSGVATVAGPYADFGTVAGAALDMVASGRGVTLSAEDRARILGGTRTLPAHADVRPALERLRQEGFRLVTLTNSAPAAVEAQLKSAGLFDLFERSFSVDSVRKFKPAPEPYRYVAEQLGMVPADLRLVAAHAWDVVGALRAGCKAAFVARPGKVLFPLGPKPDITGPDLVNVAGQLIDADQ